MPGVQPDWSQFVSRAELATALAPLGEIRDRLWVSIDRLEVGQATISTDVKALVVQVTKANGRTSKIEADIHDACERIGEIEAIATAAKTEAAAGHEVALSVKQFGCAKLEGHEDAITTLAQAGVLPEGDVVQVDEYRFGGLRKHGPRVAAGGGLVALGALLPHLLEWAKWLANLF